MSKKTELTNMITVYDGPWKEIIEIYTADFMQFFFPDINKLIDWSKPVIFLDKELQKIIPKGNEALQVDKLIQVKFLNGKLELLYIHIEIQSQYDSKFPRRMYDYNYLLSKRYKQKVVSLAILGDNNENWLPNEYEEKLAGCETRFKFPMVKLLDYKKQWYELSKNHNPCSFFVRAHLKAKETTNQPKPRLKWKIILVKLLYKEGYTDKQVCNLLQFIDWMMTLAKEQKQQFDLELKKYEEKTKMNYISSFEKRGMERGMERGKAEIILQIFKNMDDNLDAIAKLVGMKTEQIKIILKKEGVL